MNFERDNIQQMLGCNGKIAFLTFKDGSNGWYIIMRDAPGEPVIYAFELSSLPTTAIQRVQINNTTCF